MSGQAIFIIILLLVSVVLRVSNLTAGTEFLGDQGRTFLHVLSAWESKTVLLLGPTVLSGQHLGPAYYFLIAPFLIGSGFQLVWGAYAVIFYGCLGILFSALAFRLLFIPPVAVFLTALWALSPFGVGNDRFLWEPNIVPSFVMLFVYAIALILRTERKFLGSLILGLSAGILVQLHYPNLLFIPLSGLVFIILFYKDKESREVWVKLAAAWIIIFLFVLSPFLVYEFTHGFENIGSVISQFIYPTLAPIRKRQILANFIDYAGRVTGKTLPFSLGLPLGAGIIIFFTMLWFIVSKNDLSFLLLIWIVGGVGAMSLYRGVVYDHYLYFLIPAAYVVFGTWIEEVVRIRRIKPIVFIILGIFLALAFYQSVLLVSRTPVRNDILKVEKVIDIVKKELGSNVFSFGLVSSPSFSDLHYRAGFSLRGTTAGKITGNDNQIVLVCENRVCPFVDHGGKIQTLCYEDHCKGTYPIVDLDQYMTRIVKTDDVIVLFGVQ